MVTLHATPEQTSNILRDAKKKKHMKNKHKKISKSAPGITLYPSRKWKKNTPDTEEKYHNSMKQNNGFDKKKKNMVYKEKEFYQILQSKFGVNIKEKITPSQYNVKLGNYQNLSNDELENLKSGYAKYYNSKVNESRLKYKTIRENYEKKKKILSQRVEKREARENTINRLNKKLYEDLNMKENITHAKTQKRIDMIYTILNKSGYISVNHYINSDSDKELVF